jgi:hypothetical protein
MPKGKATVRGGLISRPELGPFEMFPGLLARGRRDGVAPSEATVDVAREQLREALEVYIGQHRGAVLVTATVRRKSKKWVAACAAGLRGAPNEQSARNDLQGAIDALDLNARDQLARFLNAYDRKSGTNGSYVWLRAFLNYGIPMPLEQLPLLAALEKFGATETTASWRDPFLPDLVRAAEPIWKEATGRSPFYQADEGPQLRKRYPFATWLHRVVDAASQGELEVPMGTVVDVLRASRKNRPVPTVAES